ncbi:MAG TPA: phospholipase D-like domain-containing protein, partial [Ktedonobacteraceae bacterium]
RLLAGALARGVIVALLLPDNPNVGREFTDEGLKFLWEVAPQAVSSGALQIYTLGSSMQEQGQTLYRSIYVHAKTTIVDDSWLTLGSANLNNRGMRDDTEMNVAIMHSEMVRRLRILLMAEHLGLCDEDMLFRLLETVGLSAQMRISRNQRH